MQNMRARFVNSVPLGDEGEALAKGMNTIPVVYRNPHAPLINTPKRATASLLFQAQKKINKGQNRKAILGQLRTSTLRSPAAVIPPVPPAPSATPAPPAPPSSFGGAGFSGAVAGQLGHAADPGFATASVKRPTPVQ